MRFNYFLLVLEIFFLVQSRPLGNVCHGLCTNNPFLKPMISLENLHHPKEDMISRFDKRFEEQNPKNEIVKVRAQKLIAKLKSFVLESSFDAKKFDAETENIKADIHALLWLIEDLKISKKLFDQLKFIEYMFLIMLQSSESLKEYDFFNDSDQHLMYCVLELNVRLLTMYDDVGKPDTGKIGYSYKLAKFGGLLEIWENAFLDLSEVPISTHMRFMSEVIKVEKTLEGLQIKT